MWTKSKYEKIIIREIPYIMRYLGKFPSEA